MRLRVRHLSAIALILTVGTYGYTKTMAKVHSVELPSVLADTQQADRIVISKADKTMYLLHGDTLLKRYRVSMGRAWNNGPKRREGDNRTPEGIYRIDGRNPRSAYYLSLHISYPDANDIAQARQAGYAPGENIMIHGLPNGWGALGKLHTLMDWTDGCVAVSDDEMRDIWSRTRNGTPIAIYASWKP